MYVGQIVLPAGRTQLHCGSGMYACAVVISTNPLQLTSLEGDMHWRSTVADMELQGLCEAHPRYVMNGMRRLEEDQRSIYIHHENTDDYVLRELRTIGSRHCFKLTAEIAKLMPEHADVYPKNEYEVYYDFQKDMAYGKRPWQSWAQPLGKECNLAWVRKLEALIKAEQDQQSRQFLRGE